ncbi:MAG: DUF937 domain-containing protein [Campylobacterales bacterium]|nr:DUF937 domain-containing protein [Campylobacterales bacterium]
MDFGSIINMAAQNIQNDSNEATSRLDINDIASALSGIIGGESVINNVKSAMNNDNLSETVTTWVKEGENAPLDANLLETFLGQGKVDEFASKLGIDKDSAGASLSEAIPMIIDRMSSEDTSIADSLLKQVGGLQGIIEMIMKLFRK